MGIIYENAYKTLDTVNYSYWWILRIHIILGLGKLTMPEITTSK